MSATRISTLVITNIGQLTCSSSALIVAADPSNVVSGATISLRVSGVERASLSTSGLAVTGTLSATGNITSGNDLIMGNNRGLVQTGSGAATMFFDVSTGGATHGGFSWRSSNAYTEFMGLSSTGLSVTGTLGASENVWSGNEFTDPATGTTDGATLLSTGRFFASANGAGSIIRRRTSDGNVWSFYRDTTFVGSISVTTTATAYNTSSDARLKTNIRDIANSGTIIDALRPRLFDWLTGETDTYGFVAQEVHSIFPQAVTAGDDGEEVERQWAMDPAKFMPVVIAEVKALRARVAALELT